MNTLAIISFIGAFFVGLLGVILGHLALRQISRTGERGRGLAIAGLVLGYAGCAFGAIALILVFSLYGLSL